jgi:hypothetical protein
MATQLRPTMTHLAGARLRRTERLVSLRSAMPVGLVTLRHDIPEYLPEALAELTPKESTPKVDPTLRAGEPAREVETAARKGGEAR